MSRSTGVLAFAVIPLSAVCSPPVLAQGTPPCFREQAKLAADDAAAVDLFGVTVSVSGDTVLVGARGDDDMGSDSGSAYVFVRNGTGWSQQAKLRAGDGAAADFFGSRVDLSGDTAVISAVGDDATGPESGSVYVFVRSGTGWSQQAKLVASDGGQDKAFGSGVSISEDTIVVGARLDDSTSIDAGSAYVFVRSGTSWSFQAKLVASDGSTGDELGSSVSVFRDSVVVGAAVGDGTIADAGAAYVFVRSGTNWSQQVKLTASDGGFGDGFGESVLVFTNTAVIGASGDDDAGPSSGSAYVFARSQTFWHQQAKLVASDATANDDFGVSVGVSDDMVVVGASGDDDTGSLAGSAYVFARSDSNWIQHGKFTASDAAANDRFGISVSIAGDTAVFSATGASGLSGAAYVFAPPPPSGSIHCTCPIGPCGNSDPDAGCANSTGAGAELIARGTTRPDEVNLLVAGAPPGQPAIFFQGDDAVMLPFGDGFRCAGVGLVRINPPTPIEADGSVAFGPCYGDPTLSSITGVVPGSGDTKRYQLWYRDPGGPCGSAFNLSNGYEITW